MKTALTVVLTVLFVSCVTQKKIQAAMDSWMGASKQTLIMEWGPPSNTTSDGADGEVLVYAKRVYGTLPNGSVMDYYNYTMMYARKDGTLYHWRTGKSPNPPSRVDVRFIN